MEARDASGREQGMFSVHLDTVSMWLATIETGRVRPEVREKLTRHQWEAARVLAEHFMGGRPQVSLPSIEAFTAAMIPPLVQSVTAVLREQQEWRTDQSFFRPGQRASSGTPSPSTPRRSHAISQTRRPTGGSAAPTSCCCGASSGSAARAGAGRCSRSGPGRACRTGSRSSGARRGRILCGTQLTLSLEGALAPTDAPEGHEALPLSGAEELPTISSTTAVLSQDELDVRPPSRRPT